MAGVGEISAIITIAEVGFGLSTALIGYVGDVKDAAPRIQAVADEIRSASGHLKQLGELVQDNPETHLFNDDGLQRSVELAKSFGVAITEIRKQLKKADIHIEPESVTSEEIEVSRLTRLGWPFLKPKLEVPRAELRWLKVELLLLFQAAKMIGATTPKDRLKYSKEIPRLERYRKKAVRWRDSAKEHNRTKREGTDNGSTTNSTDTMDDEEDWLEFVQYQKKLVAEKRERRFRAQRALREAEEKKEADEEEVKRKAIGDEAVNVWLAEQRLALLKEETERDRRNATIKEALRKELERLKVPPDRIDKAVAQAELDGSQTTTHQLLESQHIGPKQEASIPVLKVESTPKKNGSWLRSLLRTQRNQSPASYPGKITRDDTLPSLLDSSLLHPKRPWDRVVLEAWCLGQPFEPRTRIPLPDAWLAKHVLEQNRAQDTELLWKRFALLDPSYKSEIHDLIEDKDNLDTEYRWVIVSMETIEKRKRVGLFAKLTEPVCIQVILERITIAHFSSSADAPCPPSVGATVTIAPKDPTQPISAPPIPATLPAADEDAVIVDDGSEPLSEDASKERSRHRHRRVEFDLPPGPGDRPFARNHRVPADRWYDIQAERENRPISGYDGPSQHPYGDYPPAPTHSRAPMGTRYRYPPHSHVPPPPPTRRYRYNNPFPTQGLHPIRTSSGPPPPRWLVQPYATERYDSEYLNPADFRESSPYRGQSGDTRRRAVSPETDDLSRDYAATRSRMSLRHSTDPYAELNERKNAEVEVVRRKRGAEVDLFEARRTRRGSPVRERSRATHKIRTGTSDRGWNRDTGSGDGYRWNDESIRIIPRLPPLLRLTAGTSARDRRGSDSSQSARPEVDHRSKSRRKESLALLRRRPKAKRQGRATSKRRKSRFYESEDDVTMSSVAESSSEPEEHESESEVFERLSRNFNWFDEARARPSRSIAIDALAADTAGRPVSIAAGPMAKGVSARPASPATATTTVVATAAAAAIDGDRFFPALPIHEEPESIWDMDRRRATTAATAALAPGGRGSPLEQGENSGAVALGVRIEEAGDTDGDDDAEGSPASPDQPTAIALERFVIAPTEPEGEAEVKSGREQ